MSDIKIEGYKSSEVISAIAQTFGKYSDVERAAQLKKNNGVFEFRVKNDAGKEACWTIDLKKTGTVKKGEAKSHGLKADVSILMSDETFVELAEGKTTGQKAFMTGKLKTKGNMMLATKLDGVLKSTKARTKL
ncbi:sterol-binding-like protein [Lactarius tabidus]